MCESDSHQCHSWDKEQKRPTSKIPPPSRLGDLHVNELRCFSRHTRQTCRHTKEESFRADACRLHSSRPLHRSSVIFGSVVFYGLEFVSSTTSLTLQLCLALHRRAWMSVLSPNRPLLRPSPTWHGSTNLSNTPAPPRALTTILYFHSLLLFATPSFLLSKCSASGFLCSIDQLRTKLQPPHRTSPSPSFTIKLFRTSPRKSLALHPDTAA